MKRIPLSQGKVALVDDQFYDQLIAMGKWSATKARKTYYATRTGRPTIYMHRELFKLAGRPLPRKVDHKDQDGLNNQLANLRPATDSQSACNRAKQTNNSSGYIGVSWCKTTGRWRAIVHWNGKRQCLGRFDDPFSAAWVRDAFIRQHHGEFAVTNNLADRRAA